MNRSWFRPFHHPLSGDVIHDEFDAPPMTAFPSHARFLEFVLMTFGRHLQHLDDKSRLVFDSLHIVPESLAQKALYVSLKLLPSLIRCLLIHGNYLPFLNGALRNPGFGSTAAVMFHPGKDNGRLFHDQIILYGFYPFDAPCDFTRFIDGLLRINETAQLDRALERLDTDLE